jgi:hypothetical protein
MGLSNLQSIVAKLSLAEDAYIKGDPMVDEATLEARLRKTRAELLLAGLRELIGHEGLKIEEQPADIQTPVPWIISTVAPEGGVQRPTFGPLLAKELNRCTEDYWRGREDHLIHEVKASDHQCIRSERMLRSLLVNVALDHCNGSPEQVLDPITPAEMAAFAFPGGLLSEPEGRSTGPALGR